MQRQAYGGLSGTADQLNARNKRIAEEFAPDQRTRTTTVMIGSAIRSTASPGDKPTGSVTISTPGLGGNYHLG